ncbi:hypothetical protein K443DRAFT_628259 [Laccaria amethystina LaAM-08-1]|uniref:Unplaced genomic scaffold K443scaffold_137, whole genome shotgun sequence n=1 Tax=Laccaria amethystina LaAM-08-1 TaxID=1095629 RepID=A0A0C9XQL5_9AGAR|nr:hypothetical protein K443DRAFT_628259 [Laccaria amethystina LaAM-08-1]
MNSHGDSSNGHRCPRPRSMNAGWCYRFCGCGYGMGVCNFVNPLPIPEKTCAHGRGYGDGLLWKTPG